MLVLNFMSSHLNMIQKMDIWPAKTYSVDEILVIQVVDFYIFVIQVYMMMYTVSNLCDAVCVALFILSASCHFEIWYPSFNSFEKQDWFLLFENFKYLPTYNFYCSLSLQIFVFLFENLKIPQKRIMLSSFTFQLVLLE